MARIEQSIEVNVPAHAAYDQLTRFEQYPRFMEDVEQVRQLDDTHLHWRTRAGNLNMEWDAEITQQVPDRCIAWRNTGKPPYMGKLELQELAQDKTKITVSIDCEQGEQVLAQHGDAARAVAEHAEHSLARFKKFMESMRHEDSAAHVSAVHVSPALVSEAHESEAHGAQTAAIPQSPPAPEQSAYAGARESARAEERTWIPNLMQMWDEPLSMMRKMSEEMDQLVGKFVGRPAHLYGRARQGGNETTWTPAVEIAQSADKMVICAELPGVGRDDVRVEIKNDRVTIEGDRHPAQQGQELQKSERNYGRFYRVISLPEGAEPDAASAALHDGILEITVPVPDGGRRGRRIDIRAR